MHSNIDVHIRRLIDELLVYGIKCIEKIQSYCAKMNFADKSRYLLLFLGPASETPKRVHYWVVVVQSQNSGYEISRLFPFTFTLLLFLSKYGSGPPPSTPSKIHPGSLSIAVCPHPLSFPPISSSPSVSVQSAIHLQQRLDPHRPSVGSTHLWRTDDQ